MRLPRRRWGGACRVEIGSGYMRTCAMVFAD